MRILNCLFVCATLSAGQARADKPNFLFIISDDLTASALSCYGNTQCRTPAIDALAANGVRFTRAYCQFPVCGASRASLMSGMYPQSIGVAGNGASGRFTNNLGARPSMSQLFKDSGWYAARVSKIYHMRVPGDVTAGVSGPDHPASWNETYNCKAPEWMTKGAHEHLTRERLNKDPNKHYGLGFGTAFYVVKGKSDGVEQPDVMAAGKAIEIMRARRSEPFFLAVGLVRPHVPLVAPEPYFEPYPPADMKLVRRIENDWDDIPKAGISRNSKATGLAPDGKKRRVLSAYYAAVAFMDAQVGRLLAELERLKLRDNTVVVFTSDHGYHLGEHDFWQKMSLHEESARVPLIISAPGRRPSVSDSLAELVDLYPTLAELVGRRPPEHCQGRSLVGVLDDPKVSVRDVAYCYRRNGHLIRTDRWAYIEYTKGGAELYDMKNDPHQFTNLVDSAEHASILNEMKGTLQNVIANAESGKQSKSESAGTR